MGMFDSFYTEFEGKEHWAQTKAFACALKHYRIGDAVEGRSLTIQRGVSAHIEDTCGKGVPPWVVFLLHDGIYVDYGWAQSEEGAKQVARELIESRFGDAATQPEVWKKTLARVVEERGHFMGLVAQAWTMLRHHERYRKDPVRYEKQREEPVSSLWDLPDFQARGVLERLMDLLRPATGSDG